MLEIVFDRLVRLMTTSLRNFTSDNVEVSLDNISSIRFGDYLNSIPLPAILSVFRAEELDNFGLLTVDSNLIYSIVDVLLGGRRGTAAMRIEGRPYTTIERVLVAAHGRGGAARRHGGLRAADAGRPSTSTGWRPIRASPPSPGRPTPPSWSSCASTWKTAAAASSCCCPTRRSSRSARCCCSSSWARSSAATTSGKATWPPSSGPPSSTSRAVLDEQQVPLRQVLNLKVGDTLMLNATPDSLVELRAGADPADPRPHGPAQPPHRRPRRSAAAARRASKPFRGSHERHRD